MVKSIGTQRGLSRIETVIGVIVLVVVVASLFMLKGKFGFDEPESDASAETAADSTPQAPDPTTAAVTEGRLYFGAGSTRLPAGAEDTLGPLVATLRSDGMLNAIVTADPAGTSAEVARARAGVVSHAFEADGISAARVVAEVGASGVAASGVVRIRLQQR